MPKWKSTLVSKEEVLPNGIVKRGKTVWEPVDDAAKASTLAKEMLDSQLWVPKDPKEHEKAKARVEAAELKERKRRGELV